MSHLLRAGVLAIVILAGCDQTGTARKPAPGQARFINGRDGLSGTRLERYADFSFGYPGGWEVKRQGPGNSENYVKVTNRVNGKSVEQINLGTVVAPDQQADIVASLPALARGLVGEIAGQMGDFQVVSPRRARFVGPEGYEIRAINALTQPHEPDRKVRLNVRIVLLPDESKRQGVTLVTYEEGGSTFGGLKAIESSFVFGKR
jgi:hypothetical protein